jgi:hypothetical protein
MRRGQAKARPSAQLRMGQARAEKRASLWSGQQTGWPWGEGSEEEEEVSPAR